MNHPLLLLLPLLILTSGRAGAISVSGKILTDGGAPLAGVTMTVEQLGGELPNLTATTGADGSYSVNDPLLFGNVRVTPVHADFTFNPPRRDSFTSSNLTGQNFTASSAGQIVVRAGLNPALSMPASVSLPAISVGESSTQSFRVQNTGSGPLTGIAVTFTGPDAADFTVANPPPASLGTQGGNSLADFQVHTAPATAGVRHAVMHIASSDSLENPFKVNLTATAFSSLKVSSTADSGPGSLRDAIASAAVKPGPDRVTFVPEMNGASVVLNSEITVSDPAGVSIGSRSNENIQSEADFTFALSGADWQSTSNLSFIGDWTHFLPTGTWRSAGQRPEFTNSFWSARLTSPPLTIRAGGLLSLTFRHRYNFETEGSTNWDGGQVRLSVDDGPFQRVDVFSSNGYSSNVAPESRAEIRAQSAFCSASPGFLAGTMIESTAVLGKFFPGQTVRVQFLASYDIFFSPGEPAWEISQVSLTAANHLEQRVTIKGGPGTNRLFFNQAGSRLELNELTLSGGHGAGAAPEGAGGAVCNLGTAAITACTLHNNSTGGLGDGGAVFNGSGGNLIMDRCTLTGNGSVAGNGGAITSAAGGSLSLLHCTVAGNTSWLDGGGIANSGILNLTNSIISENRVAGGSFSDLRLGGSLNVKGANIVRVILAEGALTTGGGTLINVDPLLTGLADYGGPTPTLATFPGSPARNAAPGLGNGEDQRGAAYFGPPDIGAYEGDALRTNFSAFIRDRLPAAAPVALLAPDADFDGDGQNNETEWLTLTNPADPNSVFQVAAVVTGNNLSIRFQTSLERVYTLLQSENMASGSWIPAPGIAPLRGASGLRSLTVSTVESPRRFYKVEPSLP